MRYYTHVYNRTPTRANEGMRTPYEALYSKKPYVGNLQLFGALTYVYVPPRTRAADIRPPLRLQKMAPRAQRGLFMGYEGETIWRVYLLDQKRIERTRHR